MVDNNEDYLPSKDRAETEMIGNWRAKICKDPIAGK